MHDMSFQRTSDCLQEQSHERALAMGICLGKTPTIIPAAFVVFYPQLQSLNIMHLATPQSAILSAIIFNALIIVALIPLSLRGIAYRPVPIRHSEETDGMTNDDMKALDEVIVEEED
jgi:hypothetical protein